MQQKYLQSLGRIISMKQYTVEITDEAWQLCLASVIVQSLKIIAATLLCIQPNKQHHFHFIRRLLHLYQHEHIFVYQFLALNYQ